MPEIIRYYWTKDGKKKFAVYSDGSESLVAEYDEYGNYSFLNSDGKWQLEEVVVTGEKPKWWQQFDAEKSEQARQSWDLWMPKGSKDYGNPQLFNQLSNTSPNSSTPKALQTSAIGGNEPWQQQVFKPSAYDGYDYSRDARLRDEFENDNTQYFPNPIQIGNHKDGFHPTGDDSKSGNIKNGSAISTINPELLSLSHLTDEELIYYYHHANQQAASTSFNRNLNRELSQKILSRFIEGSGGTFTDMPEISKALWTSSVGKQTQNEIANEFKKQMKLNDGNFNGLFSNFNINLTSPSFRNSSYILQAIAGGTQQLDIELNSIKLIGRFYTATVTATIWDSYGVDEKDAIMPRGFKAEAVGARLGLQAMWILQNQRGKKPLKLGYKYTFTIKGFY